MRLLAFLGGVAFFAIGLGTRLRRPLYDILSGVTWGVREQVDRPSGLEPTTTIGPRRARPGAAAGSAGAGERVGTNRLEGELGRGGMGAVYAAWDEVLDRPVAIKLITEARDASPEFLDRFEQEARLAAQVRHENVAQVFGVGQDRNRPYMVLERLHGRTLQQLVEERGPLPVAEAWSYIGQAAAGLRAADRLGIVHRDIKPSNLMLTDDGVIKVLDFGISKLVVDEDPPTEADLAAEADRLRSDPAWRDAPLTRTGALLGTPLYMSPEQTDGRRLDCRSDIYGARLDPVLSTGRPPAVRGPRPGRTDPDAATGDPAEPGGIPWVNFTPEQAEVLDRMIAKDPTARFPDYEELLEALGATAPRRPERASFGPRVLAALIDLCIFSVPSLLAEQLELTGPMGRVLEVGADVLAVIIPVVCVWLWGITPGKWLMRLRVTRPDGGRIGLGRSLLRQLIFYPAEFLTPIGSAFPSLGRPEWLIVLNVLSWMVSLVLMNGRRRQAVHDRFADTIVVKSPRRSAWSRGRRRLVELTVGRPRSKPGSLPSSSVGKAAAAHPRRRPIGPRPGETIWKRN